MIKKIKNWIDLKRKVKLMELSITSLKKYTDSVISENVKLKNKIQKLEFEKKDFAAAQLGVYLKKVVKDESKERGYLLQSQSALENFAKMWKEYKADTMMMLTAIEYEYINNYDFTENELRVLKHVIGKIGLFFRDCKVEYDTKIELQRARIENESQEEE